MYINLNYKFQAFRKGLTKSIFTIYMERRGNNSNGEYGGQITYGELDEENCYNNELFYVVLSRVFQWQFTVQGSSVKGESDIRRRWIPLRFEVGITVLIMLFQVISDTGTSFVIVPIPVVNVIAEAIDGVLKPDKDKIIRLFALCKAKFEVTFVVNDMYGRGKKVINKQVFCLVRYLVLKEKHLLLTEKDKEGDCRVALGFTNKSIGVLGEPLMRAYCNVHDINYKRIGFARTRS